VPFTLAHAAAALPFRQTRLEFSALVTGCFAPDFPYFIFLMPHGFYGHTLLGIFVFDLPVGLVALWLFHTYVKQPFRIFLPSGVRRRIAARASAFSFLPPSRMALIVLSILIGSATHILWDSFTHRSLWLYRHWQFLRLAVRLPIAGNVETYKLLQHGSTLFGMGVLAIWVWRWYRTTEPVESPIAAPFTAAQRRAIGAILPILAIGGGILRAYQAIGIPMHARPVVIFAADAVITTISFFGLGLLACGVILGKREITRRPT
jgi:hypothetical protein